MYEISPYATFSVPGRDNRSVTTATLDYTMQFKTFGHLENEDINTIDYERSSVDFERYCPLRNCRETRFCHRVNINFG